MSDAAVPQGREISAANSERPVALGLSSVFLLLTVLAFGPLALEHFQWLWRRPQYQFFPLILGCSALVILARLPAAGETCGQPLASTMAAVLATLTIGVAMCVGSPWLATLALILLIGAAVSAVCPAQEWRIVRPAWWLLFLVLPLPFGMSERLLETLQRTAAQAASVVLDATGVRHSLAGNVVELPGHRLFVDEACSGVHSLFALVAVTASWIVISEWRMVLAVPLLVSTACWAVVMNVARIAMIVLLRPYGIDLATGWQHTALGLALFALTLVCLAGTGCLIKFLFAPMTGGGMTPPNPSNRLSLLWDRVTLPHSRFSQDNETVSSARPSKSSLRWSQLCWNGAAAGLAGLAGVQWLVLPQDSPGALGPGDQAFEAITADLVAESTLEGADFRLVTRNADDELGAVSKTWTFESDSSRVIASVDGPFDGWHDLTRCYRSLGWSVVDGDLVNRAEAANLAARSGRPATVVCLERASGDYAVLIFSFLRTDGQPLAAWERELDMPARVRGRLRRAPLARLLPASRIPDTLQVPGILQYQLLTVLTNRPDDQAVAAAATVFREFEEALLRRLSDMGSHRK